MKCTKFTEKVSGTLLGYADITVPKWGVELLGCTVHTKGNQTWVNLPQRKYDGDGEEKWAPVMKFIEKDHATAFSKKALELVDEWKRHNGDQLTQIIQNSGVPF